MKISLLFSYFVSVIVTFVPAKVRFFLVTIGKDECSQNFFYLCPIDKTDKRMYAILQYFLPAHEALRIGVADKALREREREREK